MFSDSTHPDDSSESSPVQWRPLSKVERRVAGVLIEKAKTTPANYPLTLNAVVTACNQKSNRDPIMQLDEETALSALESLAAAGAVGIVQGAGRVEKYRHYLYEWLGVTKVELSVIAELLLRGPQTLGELRSRVSRMDKIASLEEMGQIVDGLIDKGLVRYLRSTGRAKLVTDLLYSEEDMKRLEAKYSADTTVSAGVERPSPPASVKDSRLSELEERIACQSRQIESLQADVEFLFRELGLQRPEHDSAG
ncbi:YceH family protein [Thermostilla marina]